MMIARDVLGLGVLYTLSSCTMLLANKLTLSFLNAPALVCTVQYAVTAVIVWTLGVVLPQRVSVDSLLNLGKIRKVRGGL